MSFGILTAFEPLESNKMKPPLRIAILEADTPPDDIVARFGRYGKVFRTLLENAADNLGKPGFSKDDLELSAFDVVSEQKYPKLDDIDAVLISGSSESPHCPDEA